jgi:hypothetical protein
MVVASAIVFAVVSCRQMHYYYYAHGPKAATLGARLDQRIWQCCTLTIRPPDFQYRMPDHAMSALNIVTARPASVSIFSSTMPAHTRGQLMRLGGIAGLPGSALSSASITCPKCRAEAYMHVKASIAAIQDHCTDLQ